MTLLKAWRKRSSSVSDSWSLMVWVLQLNYTHVLFKFLILVIEGRLNWFYKTSFGSRKIPRKRKRNSNNLKFLIGFSMENMTKLKYYKFRNLYIFALLIVYAWLEIRNKLGEAYVKVTLSIFM